MSEHIIFCGWGPFTNRRKVDTGEYITEISEADGILTGYDIRLHNSARDVFYHGNSFTAVKAYIKEQKWKLT